MTKEEIATTLKLCRIKAGFEAKNVAEKLISIGAIKSVKSFYNWESGRTQPDADTFMYLCELYNVKNIMSTFGYEKENSPAPAEAETGELKPDERELLKNYRMLNESGKEAAQDSLEAFTYMPKYKKYIDSKEMA